MKRTGLVAAAIVCAACGGAKEAPQVETTAGPPAATVTDSTIPTQNGMQPGSMSPGTKAAEDSAALGAMRVGAMRDSAFGPRFAVDSNGKVTPIKPPE